MQPLNADRNLGDIPAAAAGVGAVQRVPAVNAAPPQFLFNLVYCLLDNAARLRLLRLQVTG
jgi:hypothetical protein